MGPCIPGARDVDCPVHKTITIECPECKLRAETPRQEYDYPEAVLMQVVCPNCTTGDFDEPVYFDKDGNNVNYDPDEIGKHQ